MIWEAILLSSAFFEFGQPEVLRLIERTIPQPGPGEVRVQVVASTVNPTDVLMRGGRQIRMMDDLSPPFVCGNEFSGCVDAIGEGVEGFTLGQRVMGIVNPRRPAGGSHAKQVCVPMESLVAAPEGLDLVEAATLPMNGLTALLALDTLGLASGRSLLVTGGAGALGGYVIELAKAQGLRVVADVKPEDEGLLRSLGVDVIVPRGEGMMDAVRAAYPRGVDALVNCALLGDAAVALVRDGGQAVIVRLNLKITDPHVRAQHITVGTQLTNTEGLKHLAGAWRAGQLTPRVGAILPPSEAAEAHRRVEAGGQRGRVVLQFTDASSGATQ